MKMNDETRRMFGIAFGHLAVENLHYEIKAGQSIDCVGVEEHDIWEALCRLFPDAWEDIHTQMYETANALLRERQASN